MAGGNNNGPAQRWKAEPTSASLCWDEAAMYVEWAAVDTHVVFNCSGSCVECCHDQVWLHDALEFYISAGINASWNTQTHVHNVRPPSHLRLLCCHC
eukprot:COSAG01_NODE_1111_length_11656_cov_50.161028_4_plen_97_part_00